MAALRWTLQAANDLEQIFDYVGKRQKSPVAAKRLVRGIYAKCQQYAEQPGLGMRIEGISEGRLRAFRHKGYLVFYKTTKKGIRLLRIVHGSRDYLALFASEAETRNEESEEEQTG